MAALAQLARSFETRFACAPRAGARAPGRVNLIGEHTDYNAGLVLPCAIDRDTFVLAAPRSDRQCRIFSVEEAAERTFHLDAPCPRVADPDGGWSAYVHGVASALCEAGHDFGGADLALTTEIPLQSGLSSSAALCVGVVTAIDAAHDLRLAARARAEIAHRAESVLAGIGCGILDPFASSLCEAGAALRIDCRSREVARVELPETLRLLVAHSGVTRSLAEPAGSGHASVGSYQDRLRECRAAWAQARGSGALGIRATSLRDATPEQLPALERALDPKLFRRVRHVVSENARVDAACTALRSGDLEAAGRILDAGMRSLRDDFEVSVPEIDDLCAIAAEIPQIHGSRLTGAGFGGCTLHLVERQHAEQAAERLAEGFSRVRGRRPEIHSLRPGPGASRLDPTAWQ